MRIQEPDWKKFRFGIRDPGWKKVLRNTGLVYVDKLIVKFGKVGYACSNNTAVEACQFDLWEALEH